MYNIYNLLSNSCHDDQRDARMLNILVYNYLANFTLLI